MCYFTHLDADILNNATIFLCLISAGEVLQQRVSTSCCGSVPSGSVSGSRSGGSRPPHQQAEGCLEVKHHFTDNSTIPLWFCCCLKCWFAFLTCTFRSMHYPPETSSIVLMAKMVAVVKQVSWWENVSELQMIWALLINSNFMILCLYNGALGPV